MRYKSEVFTAQTNDTKTLGNGGSIAFLPMVGPRGKRNVITRIIIKGDISVTTDGSTTIQTATLAAMLKRLRVFDAAGDLVNLTGPQLRAVHIYESGRDSISDAADVAVSQSPATRTIYWVIDFAPRFRARRRWDYALPVDVLQKGGGVEFTSCVGADMGTGGTPTINSQTFQFFVNCRQESDVERHVRRELREATQSNLNDFYLPVNGGLLRSAFVWKKADHDTGAATQDATHVTIEAFGWQRYDVGLLREEFLLEGNNDRASTQDPFAQSTARAIPLIWGKADEKIPEMVTAQGQVLVRLDGSSVTSNSLIYEVITRATGASTIADRDAAGGSFVKRQKTAGKTKKDPAAWGPLADYMPAKYVAA